MQPGRPCRTSPRQLAVESSRAMKATLVAMKLALVAIELAAKVLGATPWVLQAAQEVKAMAPASVPSLLLVALCVGHAILCRAGRHIR